MCVWACFFFKASDKYRTVRVGPEEATKMIRGYLWCADRLTELGLSSLEKEKLQKDLRISEGGYRSNGEGLVTKAQSNRTRDNIFKLEEAQFTLEIRRWFSPMRVMRHWKKLPREAVKASSLKCSDGATYSSRRCPWPWGGGVRTRWSFKSILTILWLCDICGPDEIAAYHHPDSLSWSRHVLLLSSNGTK